MRAARVSWPIAPPLDPLPVQGGDGCLVKASAAARVRAHLGDGRLPHLIQHLFPGEVQSSGNITQNGVQCADSHGIVQGHREMVVAPIVGACEANVASTLARRHITQMTQALD